MIDEAAAIAPGRARGGGPYPGFESLQPGEEYCSRFAAGVAVLSHIGQPQVGRGQTCVRRAIAQEPRDLVTPARGCNPIAKSAALILIAVVPVKPGHVSTRLKRAFVTVDTRKGCSGEQCS